MKLENADILRLLPDHVSGDPQFAATGKAINPILAKISKSIPNLLLWARLGRQDPKTFLPPLKRLTEARVAQPLGAGALTDSASPLRGQGLSPLDLATLESLAWQFHVDFREVARTNEQLAELVLKSIAWHRIKGTPGSMYDALILCGFDTRYSSGEAKKPYGIFIEEGGPQVHWATYQLGFEEIADYDDLRNILRICWEMQPARCRLWRVYTFDYDLRPGCWSGELPQNAWSNAWWSLWSGSYMPEFPGLDERGLLVSWGKRLRLMCEQWSKDRRVIALQEKLRTLRIYGRLFPRWSEACWSDFAYPEPPVFIVWNGWGFVIGEIMGGEAWIGKPWPARDWGGRLRNLAGNFRIGNCGINTIIVSPPDYWPVWPEERWPGANWLYGHAGGWPDGQWPLQDWLEPLRLLHMEPLASLASLFVTTIFDLSLQEPWPDCAWQDSMWRNLFCIGKKSLFQGCQIQCAQIGEISLTENHWNDKPWRHSVWQNVWIAARKDDEPWQDQEWPDKSWPGSWSNLAADGQTAAWDISGAQVLPEDYWQAWPDCAWPESAWDDSFRNIRFEAQISRAGCHCVAANSDAAQPPWPDLPWQDEVWFSPRTCGGKSGFNFQSEIMADALWLDIPWPYCAWQSKEDA